MRKLFDLIACVFRRNVIFNVLAMVGKQLVFNFKCTAHQEVFLK